MPQHHLNNLKLLKHHVYSAIPEKVQRLFSQRFCLSIDGFDLMDLCQRMKWSFFAAFLVRYWPKREYGSFFFTVQKIAKQKFSLCLHRNPLQL
jgi:hypothetical protein